MIVFLLQFGPETEQIQGGILIPDSAKEKPQEAKVIAARNRPKKTELARPFVVKVGDTVLLGKYGGTEVKLNEQNTRSFAKTTSSGVIS